jgi:hypothetical protein
MKMGDCQNYYLVAFHDIDQPIREMAQSESAYAVSERMPRTRALGNASAGRAHLIEKPLSEPGRLGAIPSHRLPPAPQQPERAASPSWSLGVAAVLCQNLVEVDRADLAALIGC